MRRWQQRPENSNWGDFGDNDELGRMNLLTPQMRRAAAREVIEGIAFCLSLPLDYPGGSEVMHTRREPHLFSVRREGNAWNYNYPLQASSGDKDHVDVTCDDAVTLYNQYSTQWDALAHYGQLFDADGDGHAETVFYNGFRANEHLIAPASDDESCSARALGIQNLAETCAQGRGTLVDLHAIYGRERVAVGHDDFMRAMETQKVEVARGDFLCLYTGYADMLLEMKKKPDMQVLNQACCGLDGGDEKLLRWISDSGIVAICADNFAVEVRPKQRRQGRRAMMPLHEHCLFKQGIHLGELWYLKDLAGWLSTHGRRHFLLTAPPLRLPESVGSPVTPVATV